MPALNWYDDQHLLIFLVWNKETSYLGKWFSFNLQPINQDITKDELTINLGSNLFHEKIVWR